VTIQEMFSFFVLIVQIGHAESLMEQSGIVQYDLI